MQTAEILAKFSEVAEAARTPEFYARAAQRKSYLTPDVIERWRLGMSPTLKQCLDAGLSERDLKSVGLLCDPQQDGGKPYMFFRDCIVIPYLQAGSVVYFSSRRLSDTLPDGSPADKSKKALSMRQPVQTDAGPWGGLVKPCGFNLDALDVSDDVLLVEGALDAIACCERGHPAVAYLGSVIKPELAELIRRASVRAYVAPDGTADVCNLKRAALAGVVGPDAFACYLSDGLDPDDLSADELQDLKQTAVNTTLAWSKAMREIEQEQGIGSVAFRDALQQYGVWVLEQEQAGRLSEIDRLDARQTLKMDVDQYNAWIGKKSPPQAQETKKAAPPKTPTGQPDPLVQIANPESRELSNYRMIEKVVPGKPDKGPTTQMVPQKIPLNQVTDKMLQCLQGWPCRLHSPGASKPMLFADTGDAASMIPSEEVGEEDSALSEIKSRASMLLQGREEISRVKIIGSVEQLRRWLHRNFKLKFRDRLDCDGANFASFSDLFHDLGACDDVSEYMQVETRPHYPSIKGHYYAFTERDVGSAGPLKFGNGSYLETFLSFFDNTKDRISRAVLTAAVVTPGWGGLDNDHYGRRPAFVITAPDRGYGKTTIAEMIAWLWGGHLSINYEQSNEEELYQRLLSIEAVLNRCAIIDNVKGTFSSSTIEALITSKKISGKRLYHGEATRPNTLTYFVTANSAKMSRDMASRSYFVELVKPQYRSAWDESIADFMAENWRHVIADIKRLLNQPLQSESHTSDRWGPWRKHVLCRVCDFLGDVTADEVVEAVGRIRVECDDDLRESRMLVEGVVEKLCWREKLCWLSGDQLYTVADIGPNVNLFIPSGKICEYFREIMNKQNLGTKQVAQIIEEHTAAGRLSEFTFKRTAAANGYAVSPDAVRAFLKAKAQAEVPQEVA